MKVSSHPAFVLATLVLAACMAEPPDGPGAPEAPVATTSAALTVEHCAFFDTAAGVPLCHHTGSAKKPYQSVLVSYRECVRRHLEHAADYIGFNDPTCTGGGCFPLGAPRDTHHDTPCCEGLDYDDSGHCAEVAATVELWSDGANRYVEGRLTPPVAGQVVWLSGYNYYWEVSGLEAVSDGDGRFTFDLSPFGEGGWWMFDPKWYGVELASAPATPPELICGDDSHSGADPWGRFPGLIGCSTRYLSVACDSLFDDFGATYLPGTMALEFDANLNNVGEPPCVAAVCPEHATLDALTGRCLCESGMHASGVVCVPTVYTTWPVAGCDELVPALTAATQDRHAVVELQADIDLGTCAGGAGRRSGHLVDGWLRGRIAGNGHALRGYRSDRPLFIGLDSFSEVTDLFIVDADVQAPFAAAVLAFDVGSFARMSGVRVSGVVVGSWYAGGIVTSSWDATIEGSSFEGSVTATSGTAGGLIASFNGSENPAIADCYATGTVTASEGAGGLAGEIVYGARMRDSFFRGDVVSTHGPGGGLVGYVYGKIDRCYAAGTVSGGGYLGRLGGNGTTSLDSYVHDSYAEGGGGQLFGAGEMHVSGCGFASLAEIYADVISAWSPALWRPDPTLETDPELLCGGEVCVVSCGEGTVLCGADCVDPESDREHCGATAGCGAGEGHPGTACGVGEACVAGACEGCPAGTVLCGADCVDPDTDPGHCGASGDCSGEQAGVSCPDGAMCEAGLCTAPPPPPNATCPGGAIDVSHGGVFSGTTFGGASVTTQCGGGGPGVYYFARGPGLYLFQISNGFALQFDAYTCGSGIAYCSASGYVDIMLGVDHYVTVQKVGGGWGEFTLSVVGDGPVPVDECAQGTDGCDDEPDACYDTSDGWYCACPPGYVGEGQGAGGCVAAPALNYLKASNSDASDGFGFDVAVSADGTTVAVGAWFEGSAASGVWGDGAAGAAGADNSAPHAGAVYVYRRTGEVWALDAYVKASNSDADDWFGYALALSADGTRLAVGAPLESSAARGVDGDDSDDSAQYAGAVYVFDRGAGGWAQTAYLKASNNVGNAQFGSALALSSDGATLAVGAKAESSGGTGVNNGDGSWATYSGAAYVFEHAAGWSEVAFVKASNTEAFDFFGSAVALSGDGATLAVGASDEKSGAGGVGGDQYDNSEPYAGAAYVFRKVAGVWAQEAYVKASNPGGDYFGTALALSGDGATLAVGAYLESSSATGVGGEQNDESALYAGAVYVFRWSGGWAQEAYIKAANSGSADYFGYDLALSDDGASLAVGAPNEASAGAPGDNSLWGAGAVYRFMHDGQWAQVGYLKASNADAYDSFGWAVALAADGVSLVVGALHEASDADGVGGDPGDNSAPGAGAAYVY